MGVPTFAMGAVAVPIFGLGFLDAALVIVLANLLGVLPVCFFATFGPKFGLRQIVLSRFFFGYYAVKILAICQILTCLGWASVNAIVGAQLFHAVNPDVPGWAGIIVVATTTLIVSMFGYKAVHFYERYSWIPCFVIFLIIMGAFIKSGNFNSLLPLATGPTERGAVLSYIGAVFGFACGWSAYSADYSVYQPSSRSTKSVFWWVFGGLMFPLLFVELLGAAVATALVKNADYATAYDNAGVGGLMAAVLEPNVEPGFDKACLVLVALSIIANNCPNIYSVSFSLQALAKQTRQVPRFVWTIFGTGVYVGISIPGYDRFETWLETFVLSTGYWLAIYVAISLVEHFVFRGGFHGYSGYDVEDITSPQRLPPGFAAIVAFLVGVIGVALGMSQEWYTGVIAKLCGGEENGGDVGVWLGFTFSFLTYIGLRALERSCFGR
ncbi:permease for cytosine/purines, uracil, thiamine, allantoin-domain-containing protein [Apiosordaria backusii]|uniref:Permease for cytosine/purines, uracil, thiamine, allantoin-domain-containing protein n=1 Tax=Apiosordaria backusii TaxID=314023 RepID=A0AA40K6R7_9PEZI|nr:permease for cytosine/purines, uracil, thiamine, allantoin-domain-containing protein [Apiosordaria backusii]